MLGTPTLKKIEDVVQRYWKSEVKSRRFIDTAKGKEVGHRIADLVDDKTTALLTMKFATRYQRDKRGHKVPRSMGDIWLKDGDIFHPINVKTGISGKNGQPNMVSLKKVLAALLLKQIDSYYLLMVKMNIAKSITSKVFLIDMLDYLDYVHFDSGPGQIMLKSKLFFDFMETGKTPPKTTIGEKVMKLLSLLEDGERRLMVNRRRALTKYRKKIKSYSLSKHVVTPDTQKSLLLG